MEAQESAQQSSNTHKSFKKSWTAYFNSAIIFLVMLLVSLVFFNINHWFGIVLLLLSLGIFTYQILLLRSYVLYTDEYGAWVYSGILPWSKGIIGVKWRDMEDAVYFSNFLSWALKSYTVRIGHRFTKTSEIIFPHMQKGHDAVIHINQLHRQLLSSDNIER
jgi:hypothetical protein